MEWWLALAALVVGVLAGFYLATTSDRNKRRADTLQDKLDSVSTELDDYRNRVTKHFVRTAELVDALAANSREIYNHLADGSQNLCDTDAVKLKHDAQSQKLSYSDDASVVVTDNTLNTSVTKSKSSRSENTTPHPEEGWFEILPETDEKNSKAEEKSNKKKVEEPAL